MYQIDFNKPIHIYFIGIGGISMSGLAQVLLHAGFQVSGSDTQTSELTKDLEKKGANIYYGQLDTHLSDSINLVVYTAAIKKDNPEMLDVASRKLPILTRAQLLGQIMKNFELPVAVSGTHGKTTTTSMISEILLEANFDPTLSIGGMLKEINANVRVGGFKYFVTEACEYTDSFLSFFPKIGVILNIEEDHLDYFKDISQIRDSFHNFAKLLPPDGCLIINGNIENYKEITKDLPCKVITFGDEKCDYMSSNITYDFMARPTFTLVDHENETSQITLSVPGNHNISNALAAIAVCSYLNVPFELIQSSLKKFSGSKRRFEYKGSLGDIRIIDDYAHHPTEIKATLSAIRNYPHREVWCIFQPHTYTRTKAFLKEFADALSLADHVVLSDIYAAREINTTGISSKDLMDELIKLGVDCNYFTSFDEIENYLLANCIHDDLLITMGAGDVVKIGESLLGF